MRTVRIPKRNGSYRTIVVPDAETKTRLRSVGARIATKASHLPTASVVHGFVTGRSPVTNALAHVGHQFTLSFDLKDFFESVTAEKLRGKISNTEIDAVLYEGRAAQGLPSSPSVANVAASDLDKAILRALDRKKVQAVYTRYADDLTFSFDAYEHRAWLLAQIPHIVARCGFKVNDRKTEFQCAGLGRRIVTGVAVDDQGVHPTRALKRRLRAALHQKRTAQARGLAEVVKCNLPRPRTAGAVEEATRIADEAQALAKCWNLRVPRRFPARQEVRDGDFILTGDPAYVLGMSTYTTGWTSCMRQPDGQYRMGVVHWLQLEGTRVAALLSDRTETYAGVARRLMRARCLVHALRNGVLVYDRLYGDPSSAETLRAWLVTLGAMSVNEARENGGEVRVVGNVPRGRAKPYMDSLRAAPKLSGGRKVWVMTI